MAISCGNIHRIFPSPIFLPGKQDSVADFFAPQQARSISSSSSSSSFSSSRRTFVCAAAASNGRPGAAERQEYSIFDDEKKSTAGNSSREKEGAASSAAAAAAATKKVYGSDAQGNFGDMPYRTIPGLGKYYLDELDVITLLNPPYLSPLDPASYNHAAFIWKKIGDVSEERRVRLLDLMRPSLTEAMWKIARRRYDTPKLFSGDAFTLLPAAEIQEPFQKTSWLGKVGGEVWPWNWLRDITMDFFIDNDGGICGQLKCSGLFRSTVSRSMPLYFRAQQAEFVCITNEECDLVLDFSSGGAELRDELPPSFGKPEKLSWPLEDFVIYIRPVGPGVLVGELWQKRIDPNQAPPRKLGKLVIIKGV